MFPMHLTRTAEQIVRRERRERLSQLAWCGAGCFDSRRRVNSTVGRPSNVRRAKMIRTRLVINVLMLLTAHSVWPQDKPSLSEVDRIRLAEAFRLGESLGNRVWKDWDKAPFAVLLVTPEY